MKLYQFPLSPNCQRVVALAHELGTPLTIVNLDVFAGAAKSPQMLAKNPNGLVPVLEEVLELDPAGVRTIDHFKGASAHRALFAAGLPDTVTCR